MLSLRAPLFSVSLAFATGCLIGFDGWVSLAAAFTACLFTGIAWLLLARRDHASLGAFYLFTACAGAAHVLLLAAAVPGNDVRRLPDEKCYASTQWRAVIVEEPVDLLSTKVKRRSLDRCSFVARVEAWRPTGGRLFDAPVDTPWQSACGDVRCTLLGSSDLKCGDVIEFAAPLESVTGPLSPGELDRRAWEAKQGIYYYATIAPMSWKPVASGGGYWWQRLAFTARDWAYDRLRIGLEDDPRTADFLAGMLIGYRQQIPVDIQDDFRRTGTLHVFAVSGQNVAEVVLVALLLLQLFGLVPWRWAWSVVPLIVLYCLLTGAPASAARATMMALAALAAWRMGRPLGALACWSLVFLAMLIWNPVTLLDPGAELSFGVVLALILLAPPLMRALERLFAPDSFLPRKLLSRAQALELRFWRAVCLLVATSLAASMISEPITAIAFHQVTPISVLANLAVVPLAGLITVVGTISLTASLYSTWLAGLFNNANWLFARIMIGLVAYLAHLPCSSFNVPDVRAVFSPKPSFVVAPAQGTACLLVRTPQGDWLFNAGRESPTPSTVWRLLQFYGINRLEGLVLTQISTPDNGGAERIVRDFHPQHLVVPALSTHSPLRKTLEELSRLSGRDLERWQRGDIHDLAPGIQVCVLHPEPDDAVDRAEDRSLILLFEINGQTLLWAGRPGEAAQAQVYRAFPGLQADVLVMDDDPPLNDAWICSLHPRDWLQIPSRYLLLNVTGAVPQTGAEMWPMEDAGSVDIHFVPAANGKPPMILLQPWLALPETGP